VGHGLGREVGPIQFYPTSTIPIQQHSRSDLALFDKEIEDGKRMATNGYPPYFRYRPTIGYWERQHAELHSINPVFGDAVMSELDVLEYEGGRRLCDYVVIRVDPNRMGGRNYVGRDGLSTYFETYIPRRLRDYDLSRSWWIWRRKGL
jgi:hypothetical protein